jgi:hypothetical protein
MLPQDRRSAPRIDSGNLVIHHELSPHADPAWEALGVTLDLNEFGLRAQVASEMKLGGRYRFTLALEEDLAAATGRVVHVARTLNSTFEIGVEFLQISMEDITRVRSYLRRRKGKTA